MSDLILSFLTTTLTINRTATGTYVDGRFVPGVASTFTADANIQNSTPDETLRAPEGRRGGELKTVHTAEQLIPSDETAQTKGDSFIYKGNKYEVFSVEDWSDNTDLPHFLSLCEKSDDLTGADDGN